MDKPEFVANLNQVKQRKVLLLRIGLSLLFVTICGWMWLSKTAPGSSTLHGFKTIAIAVFAALAYGFLTHLQKLSRRLGLHCPSCNRNLSGPLSHKVVESGNCFQCGTKLF